MDTLERSNPAKTDHPGPEKAYSYYLTKKTATREELVTGGKTMLKIGKILLDNLIKL